MTARIKVKGNKVELLANEIGDFQGTKAMGITNEGKYLFDITAKGNWKIDIDSPIVTTPTYIPTITGFPSSPVNNNAGDSRIFNITANQIVNVTWY